MSEVQTGPINARTGWAEWTNVQISGLNEVVKGFDI